MQTQVSLTTKPVTVPYSHSAFWVNQKETKAKGTENNHPYLLGQAALQWADVAHMRTGLDKDLDAAVRKGLKHRWL